MRYAIISDIHSNLQALYSAFDVINKNNIDEIVCLGDIVGYNAYPLESLRFLRANPKAKIIIRGNHEELAVSGFRFSDISNVSDLAVKGIRHSIIKLDEESKVWLQSLPRSKKVEDKDISFTIMHGIGGNNGYVLDFACAQEAVVILQQHYKTNIAFFGHSHLPTVIKQFTSYPITVDIWDRSMVFAKIYEGSIDVSAAFDGSGSFLFNPGAIGQPRGKSKPSFIIFDTSKKTVQYIFFEYDVVRAKEGIIKANLPEELAERLEGKD